LAQSPSIDRATMIQIRYEPDDVVITIPKDQAASAYVQDFLERVRIDAKLGRSQAGESAIDALAEQIDAAWWEENKDAFLAGTPGAAETVD
jgi:hypothetical protein